MGWVVDPTGLLDTLVTVNDETPDGLALYITENGCAAEDSVTTAGEVDDVDRIAYLHGHLAAAHRAVVRGVPLAGYFVWSLLDNFEWAWGYDKRFGLVFVDFDTQQRVPKNSASFYGEVAATNALPADAPGVGASVVDGASIGEKESAAHTAN
jgi:beta-glucosidase